MATPDAFPETPDVPGNAALTITTRHRGVPDWWRARSAERKHARLLSARHRRALARWLRLTAKLATDRDSIRRRHDVLLHYRAAAVRSELLEIAALLDRALAPDPASVQALHDLLAHSGRSPLYDSRTPFSELEATLEYIRSGL